MERCTIGVQEYLASHPKLETWLEKTGSFGEEDQDLFEGWKRNMATIEMETGHIAQHLASNPESDLYLHFRNVLSICHTLSYLVHWSMTYGTLERQSHRTVGKKRQPSRTAKPT